MVHQSTPALKKNNHKVKTQSILSPWGLSETAPTCLKCFFMACPLFLDDFSLQSQLFHSNKQLNESACWILFSQSTHTFNTCYFCIISTIFIRLKSCQCIYWVCFIQNKLPEKFNLSVYQNTWRVKKFYSVSLHHLQYSYISQ